MTYTFADHAPEPWAHQRKGFDLSKDREYFALFMEQRTGKSRVIIDTAAYAYERGFIDGVLLLAPNGVHRNWITEGFGQFLPRRIPAALATWRTGLMDTKKAQEQLTAALGHDGLTVLSMNYDALNTVKAKAYLGKFLRKRKLMVVGDESDDLSTPGAKRTQTAIRAAKYGIMRRILTGTPAAEDPFGLYAQTNFLKMFVLGYTSFLAFKHRFGEWEEGYNGRTDTTFETLKRSDDGAPCYRNLDELQRKLDAFSFRVTRVECGGQLPTLVTRPFELHETQRRLYNHLREEYVAELQDGTVTAAMVLVRYARLQQITSGFVPLDRHPQPCPHCAGTDPDCSVCFGLGVVLPDGGISTLPNPRLDALEREVRGASGATVVWTRFIHDADAVMGKLRAMGRRPGRYDGTVKENEREQVKLAFQRGDLSDIVANPQAGGRGLDFSRARTTIFYSHHWSLRLRLQAQDRIETLKHNLPSMNIDLVADDTVDEIITQCHRDKRAVQDVITNDRERIYGRKIT